MINAIKNILLPAALSMTLLVTSCNDEQYMRFDLSQTGIYFTKDTLNYSFSVTPIEIKEYTYNIPVRVMGSLSKETRPVAYVINPDYTTAEEGVQFTIGEACVLPDSINGYIPVTIHREHLAGSYPDYTRYELCLQLVSNEYFTPTLDSLSQVRVLRFDNSIEQPDWRNAYGEKVWQEKYLGKWHPYKFIKMVEYFGAVEQILPETFNNMVAEYGRYLEHIPFGDPNNYRTIFVKYIYWPMYEFFNDPANEEAIKAEFPDFIFDFPNPYTVG